MESHKSIADYSPKEIRELVSCKYSEVALSPHSRYKFKVGQDYALDLGYPVPKVQALPEKIAETFTGVSSFLSRFEDFTPGEVILELGSGGGFDTALLAEKLGGAAKVIGVDLSFDMVRKAARSLGELEYSQVSYTQAEAEELPLGDNSVDWVVSNGIFNLSPEKERILSEIHRVLKPRGRVVCSEIVLYQEPSPEERLNEDDWFK